MTDVYQAVGTTGSVPGPHEVISMEEEEAPLLFTCVARDMQILAEQMALGEESNVRSCILALLQTAKFENPENYHERAETSGDYLMERFSISYGTTFVVHVAVCDPWRTKTQKRPPLVFLVVADKDVGIVTAFGFLYELIEAVKNEYRDSPEIATRALTGALQKDLGNNLTDLLDYWSSERAKYAPELAKMKGQINGVKEVMMSNLDEMIRRKDQIEILVEKTEMLEADSHSYRRVATDLQRHEWWKTYKLYFQIAGVFACLLFLIYLTS